MKCIEIIPLRKAVTKTVSVPGSKSYTNRALILAALTRGSVKIRNPLWSDDVEACISCLNALGIETLVRNKDIIVKGHISDVAADRTYELDVRYSGTTARFILALSILVPGIKIIRGRGHLNKRPIGELVEGLRRLGADIEYLGEKGCTPLRVGYVPQLKKSTRLSGDISSQYFSAILMIAPHIGDVDVTVIGNQISKPYIEMTIDTMRQFGIRVINKKFKKYTIPGGQIYKTKSYMVEGDVSSAAYFFAIAVLTKSVITLKNLNPKSKQADMHFLELLRKMGNKVTTVKNGIRISGKALRVVNVDMEDSPDQVQTLAVLMSFVNAESVISGIRSLRLKETDRVAAVRHELNKMGIRTRASNNVLTIWGGSPRGARIDTYNDHRMAMSFAVAGTKLSDMQINDPDTVAKTFPEFWKKIASLSVQLKTHDK